MLDNVTAVTLQCDDTTLTFIQRRFGIDIFLIKSNDPPVRVAHAKGVTLIELERGARAKGWQNQAAREPIVKRGPIKDESSWHPLPSPAVVRDGDVKENWELFDIHTHHTKSHHTKPRAVKSREDAFTLDTLPSPPRGNK